MKTLAPHAQRGWIATWAMALTLFFACLISVESAWRYLRYHPSVVDSPALWQFWYRYALSGEQRAVVLVGSSRMQAGISTAQMRRNLPQYRVSQLAIYKGIGPIGVVRSLASEKRFRGIVICDLLEPFLFRASWSDQQNLYESPTDAGARLDAFVSAGFQDVLATKHTSTGVRAAFECLLNTGRPPSANRVRIRLDRSLDIDFSKLERGEQLSDFITRDVASARARYQAAQLPTPQELADEFVEIEGFVRQIQARGGQVVFVRMPSTGRRLALENEFHSKSAYWDRFVAASSAICIHSSQLAGVADLNCPDDSHLDSGSAHEFTSALIDELKLRGVLR